MKTEQPETEPPAQQIGGQHAQPQTQQSAETPSQQFGGVSSRERRARSNRTWQQMQYMGAAPEFPDDQDDGARGNEPG